MTKFDTRGIAAMLAANPNLEILFRLAPALDSDSHQIANAIGVEFLERILLVDPARQVIVEEPGRVVARQPVGHLRQVVGAERKEVRHRGNRSGLDARARHFDHRANEIGQLAAAVAARNLARDFANIRGQQIELLALADERQHDLGNRLDALLLQLTHRFEDGARLRTIYLGMADAETGAAQAEHGIELLHAVADLAQSFGIETAAFRELANLVVVLGQELMQRRIEQTNRDRLALHLAQDRDEILDRKS